MTTSRKRRLTGVLAVVLAAGTGVAVTSGTSSAHPRDKTLDLQILSFNDFHGNLEAPGGSSGRIVTDHQLVGGKVTDVTTDAGGVEYLATHLREARAGQRNTVTVAAGDIVGASPLLSAAFHDEPTIEAMNALGLEASAVGNHEFDEGYKELQRLQAGGCLDDGDGKDNQNSCAAGTFEGANFHFLAANVALRQVGDRQGRHRTPAATDARAGSTILPSYWIKNFGHGAKVGFIGMTLKETPTIVTQAGVAGLEFNDEVKTANALVPELRKKGVKAIVVLIHQGGTPSVQKWTGPGRQGLRRQRDLRLHLRQGRQPDRRLGHPADRGQPRPADRHGHLRAHPPALRLQRARPQGPAAAGHLGVLLRPALHRDRPEVRHPHRRHRAGLGQGHQHGGHRATWPRPPTRPS